MIKINAKSGLSLIEVLVTVLLFSMILLVLFDDLRVRQRVVQRLIVLDDHDTH